MNSAQVKALLLRLEDPGEDFTVVLSGKSSRKVHGLYKPETREIVLHNRNFEDDGELVYTAIHEYAHHLHAVRSPRPVGSRAHGTEFRAILHGLLEKAERMGIWRNPFRSDPVFAALTEEIRSRFLEGNARLMKEFGEVLARAERLCLERRLDFDDYVERELGMPRQAARVAIRVAALGLPERLGYERMRVAASVKDPERRAEVVRAFEEGRSVEEVRQAMRAAKEPEEDRVEALLREKRRIEAAMARLAERLKEIDRRLEEEGRAAAKRS